MPMKIATLLIAGLLFTGSVYAQKGVEDGSKFGHGEDSVRCLENLSLYYEYYKQKNYAEAYPKWEIAFNECPASNKNLYSHGERIVESLYRKEKDAAKKAAYYDLLMKVYDQRAKYFGNDKRYPTAYIMGKKAITMLRYGRDDAAVIKEVQPLLKNSYKELGVKTQYPVLLTYMINSAAMYKLDNLSGEELVNIYTSVTETLNTQKTALPKYADKIQETIVNVEKIFAQSGAANCETLAEIFGPQLADHTDDLAWLKRVNRLLAKGDCGESELFYQSSEYLHNIEPSASSAFGLSRMYMKTGDTDKAISFLTEAISLEEDADSKAKYHNTLGLIYMSKKQYSKTRAEASKAIALRGNWGDPYILIGKAYAASAQSIGSNEFEHKTAYWAAVDQFAKAKAVDAESLAEANENIALYSQYFPNTEEIFFQGLKVGDSYKVGGWIGVNTTVRAK
ncbi:MULTISPECIES: tetratricopeptide repeat protein [unclassified Carboxylicivirga]|uniref:tetratricopeptide repeat protein n=1 Tax=Carboxylicivirga TaxID=1628153 RepID=UPI003D340088